MENTESKLPQEDPTNLFKSASNSRSILKHPYIKIVFIVLLTLIMTIPNLRLRSLINERDSRRVEVIEEVTSKWSEGQVLSGPILVLPYVRTEKTKDSKTGKMVTLEFKKTYYILPDNLKVDGKVATKILGRSIYKVPVYNSDFKIDAAFSIPEEIYSRLDIKLLKDQAYLAIGVKDMRGIDKAPQINYQNTTLEFESSSSIGSIMGSHLRTKKGAIDNFNDSFKINASLAIKGSKFLYFKPLGKYTEVKLEGDWSSPSFDGDFLPSTRSTEDNVFSAKWNVLSHNRTYPQFWNNNNEYNLPEKFGVKLLMPVDHYQKSDRSVKYSILIIALSFIALYFIEIIRKQPISIISYALIAAALIIYYALILSIGEHTGFNTAYMIASGATIMLIGLFAKGLLGAWKPAIILSFILMAFYIFIFVTLQQEDYALLVGSIGLFIVLGIIMFASQKIKDFKEIG